MPVVRGTFVAPVVERLPGLQAAARARADATRDGVSAAATGKGLSMTRQRRLRSKLRDVDTLIALIDLGASAEELLSLCFPMLTESWRSLGMASAALKGTR